MNRSIITFLTTLALSLGLVACKSGGGQEGPASAPAASAESHDEHAAAGHHGHAATEEAPSVFDAPPPVGTKAKCPVSGEIFTVEDDTDRGEHDGKHFVFCCSRCVDKFNADPAKFAGK